MSKAIRLLALVLTLTLALTTLRAQSPAASADSAIPADQQATREQVLQLYEVMHIRDQMQRTIDIVNGVMLQQIEASLKQTNAPLTAEKRAQVDKIMAQAATLYPVNEMLDDIVPVYQRHISRQDITAVIAFYSTPAGQHILTAMPQMMQDTMVTITPKLTQRMKEFTAKAIRDTQSSPATPTSKN